MKAYNIKRELKKAVLHLPPISAKRKKYINLMRGEYDYSQPMPTIICSSCIGGMISHNLGLKFMSPTINLWFMPTDLTKLVSDIDGYINTELCEVNTDKYPYPVGKLKDITLYFNHYPTFKAAAEKWNERKTRIDKNNLYIITDDKFLTDSDIAALESVKCRRCIIFTKDEERDELFFRLKAFENADIIGNYSVRDLKGFSVFEREFNYSAWLNGENNIRM